MGFAGELTPLAQVGGFLASVAGLALMLSLAMRFRFKRSARAPLRVGSKKAGSMLPIHTAAERAYQQAKAKKMVVAFLAEQDCGEGGPIVWFERSIVSVVPVYKRERESDAFVLTNVRDLEDGLFVREKELRRYMRWARGLW